MFDDTLLSRATNFTGIIPRSASTAVYLYISWDSNRAVLRSREGKPSSAYKHKVFDDTILSRATSFTGVCWVTQLVVHSDFRERGLAFGLLNYLRQDDDAIYGIMSSHPATCLAAAKAFGRTEHIIISFYIVTLY